MNDNKYKIKVLPENLINKIAAGEVIDRPSSVVKEMIENSIDAGADRISVIIKGGGTSLIQIIDNGSGMEEQDAIMSFQRHATSKIETFADVERIGTLGFRGEALASIASVSQVEMRTVPKDAIEGTLITIDGGIVQKVDHTGGNHGTMISVKNLFFNTPGRRKFLRTPSTEYRHILSVINRFTLCYPQIGFSLVNEEKEVFNYKPVSFEERLGQVLGERVKDHVVKVQEKNALFNFTGFIGDNEIIRKSRNDQFLFVNNRYITDRTIGAAVVAGYGDTIPKGTYPLYVLLMDIKPERIDVNVHPTKSEIKFADQQMIYSLVRGAIKRTLASDQIVTGMDFDETGNTSPVGANDFKSFKRRALIDDMRNFSSMQTSIDFDAHPNSAGPVMPAAPPMSHYSLETTSSRSQQPPASESVNMFQFHNKFILSQIKSGIVLIDQHAAHERILYEKAIESFRARDASSQQLLFPETVELSPEDFQYLMDILPFLEKLGFVVKGFGGRTIIVEGVPSGMRIGNEEKALLDILDEYKIKLGTEVDIQERVAKSFACRSSIMAGERLSYEAMNTLVDQLFACDNPYFCPHGRPTMITISMDELDKRFERK